MIDDSFGRLNLYCLCKLTYNYLHMANCTIPNGSSHGLNWVAAKPTYYQRNNAPTREIHVIKLFCALYLADVKFADKRSMYIQVCSIECTAIPTMWLVSTSTCTTWAGWGAPFHPASIKCIDLTTCRPVGKLTYHKVP